MEHLLLGFIEHALSDTSETHLKLELGCLSEQDLTLIEGLTSKDCTGFVRILDKFAVRHVFKKHGDVTVEQLRGQLAVAKEDFLLIPLVVATYIRVSADTNKLGNPILRYEWETAHFKLVYVEEIRNKRREIALQTLYKQKTRQP